MKNESKICRRRKEKKQDNWSELRIRMRVIDQKLRERERESLFCLKWNQNEG